MFTLTESTDAKVNAHAGHIGSPVLMSLSSLLIVLLSHVYIDQGFTNKNNLSFGFYNASNPILLD